MMTMAGGGVTTTATRPIPQAPVAPGKELSVQVWYWPISLLSISLLLYHCRHHHCSLCSAICATPPIHSQTCLLRPWYPSSPSSSSSSPSSSSPSSSSSSSVHFQHFVCFIWNTSQRRQTLNCDMVTPSSQQLHSGVNDGPVLHWKDLFHKSSARQRVSR